MGRKKSVLLLGSYGQSNLGDDLLMWNFLGLLRDQGYEEIYVNANTTQYIPKPVKQAYPHLRILNTYKTSILTYVKLIRRVDCIIYGGGTLYKELYATTGRGRYSVIARMMGFNVLARLFGTKLYHLNIGIGSLKTTLGRMLSKIALNAATKSIFRDEASYRYAKDTLGIAEEKIELSTDGLFISRIWQRPWHKATLRIDRKKYKNVIGVNILSDIPDWIDRDAYIQTMRQFVLTLLDRGNYVVFVPFQHAFNPRNDLKWTHQMFDDILAGRSGYKILTEVPIDFASSYLQQCDLFVGMRFHSLLLSTVNQVPFLAVAYDTKCWRFIEESSYPYAIKLEDLQLDPLIHLFEEALIAKDEIKVQLGQIARRQYMIAEEGIRTLNL
ncbi:polysaccharide pyruvyl transferase family protein [Streptomyces caniscabiei]|uniref:polysaccharide pyruvyl transferase family protein n=1 Tax=Streptomyces caniscabiei TaxID=2746961 RepID=UPI0029BD2833|nr:polysaccharide pyruvyl transferase family protein [Streptomyces caniscabiei]MDX2776446.1 polysaccharide pyruvyl transferase family protein [Streptomyces caniscabiei]